MNSPCVPCSARFPVPVYHPAGRPCTIVDMSCTCKPTEMGAFTDTDCPKHGHDATTRQYYEMGLAPEPTSCFCNPKSPVPYAGCPTHGEFA